MPSTLEPLTIPKPTTDTGSDDRLAPTYHVICWNDPVNLMVYVTHVFQKVFGWERQKAEKHMLEVHENGKSVLVREGAEKAEFYVHQLQYYKLHATMEPAE
ncbi:MAG: ATP-dependent Clp protease adaptor ClpS [Limisphaerales bacterium]